MFALSSAYGLGITNRSLRMRDACHTKLTYWVLKKHWLKFHTPTRQSFKHYLMQRLKIGANAKRIGRMVSISIFGLNTRCKLSQLKQAMVSRLFRYFPVR